MMSGTSARSILSEANQKHKAQRWIWIRWYEHAPLHLTRSTACDIGNFDGFVAVYKEFAKVGRDLLGKFFRWYED